jgi:predicted AlkP superfamily phosphohydrolase/phosphomutase
MAVLSSRIMLTAGFLCLLAAPAYAYIGPGAGFVLAPLFLGLVVFLLVMLVIIGLPFLVLFRMIFRKKPVRGPVNRVVVVGLDGMDPEITRGFLERGLLPNFAKLADSGHFGDLGTATPSISPCAWSTFMTGTDASRHNIFDFITRDPCTYLPLLTSAKIEGPRKTLSLGKFRIPLGKPVLTMLRKSKPFWQVLSQNRIFSTILRVPITFPAEPFHGHLLSGMCVPDLRGTQGSFSFFTTEKADGDAAKSGFTGEEGGVTTRVEWDGDVVKGEIVGPKNTLVEGGGDLTVPFAARVDRTAKTVELSVGKEKIRLREREYSPWIRLEFRPGLGIKVRGIVRFYVTSIEPEFGLYVTPIQIDPEKPAIPISHPVVYSVYLARMNGPFATLGLAEDTWALNERVLDEEGFLKQAWHHYEEREKQLFTALRTTRSGSISVVFDTTDRVQHMFYRYLEPDHPANEGKDTEKFATTIADLYVKMDDLVGRVRKEIRPDDALFVISDHGFTSFRRGVNINTWLLQNGYLALKNGDTTCGEWFDGVDWENTKAFSLGLTGLFLNRQGREAKGTVAPGDEAKALKAEIAAKLCALTDPATGEPVIRKLYDADEIFDGPYRADMPDFILGYERGYRNSWEAAVGRVTEEVVTDNTRSWSGDHCVDPELVPGVIFSDRKVRKERPMLEDMAPTVLELLGVEPPGYMTGGSRWSACSSSPPAAGGTASPTGPR